MTSSLKHILFVAAMFLTYSSASAYDFEADGFYFNVTNQTNNEVEVTYKTTSYNTTYTGAINIPSTVEYNGTTYSVTSIGSSAFSGCIDLFSVTIPNSVTSIGASAFYNCSNIRSLTIGTGVTSISNYAFSEVYGNSISKYTIPKVIWLGNTPPSGVSNVKADLNYVSNSEFSLSNRVVYPFLSSRFEVDGVVYVPVSPSDRTCDVIDCNYDLTNTEIKIESIVINKNVELTVLNINAYAFYQNPKITKLEISNNGYIGDFAFWNSSLTTVIANNNGYIGNQAFYRCGALTSVIASNKGYIGEKAFYDCDALTSVVASNKGYIGKQAFYSCDNLTTLTATNEGHIGEEAFKNCVKLKTADLNISGGIRDYAFSGCTLLETANINIVGSIENYGFEVCKNLTSVKLGDYITSIGSYAFSGNSSLETIVIPNNITSLGTYAFSGCTALKNVSIGRGVSSLPQYVFNNCNSLSSILIPYNINIVDNYAFDGCTNLGDVTFEEFNTNKLPQYFPNWTSTNHTDSSSSSYEYNIDVVAGDVLSFEIWSDSESVCDKLTVYLNGTSIANISGRNQTQNITRTFNNAQTVTLKVVYSKDSSKSEGADEAGIRNIVLNDIPELCVNLGSNGSSPLFSSCKLDEVYIGRKLSYKTSSNYGYSPFYRNTSLRKVTVTDAETQIYDNEFYGCSNLQEFSCGDGVTSIGKWAFSGCSSLESYLSGTSVETIGQEAFSDCTAMTSFTTNAQVPPTCGTQALDDINKWECTLYVPQESLEDYKAAPQWKEFFFIEDSGVDDVTVDNIDVSSYPVEIYNLSGLKVGNSLNNLAPGIYIKRQGTKTEKIMVN